MWKKILWSEVKEGQRVYACWTTDDNVVRANAVGRYASSKVKTGQRACAFEESHAFCIAWVEEVTLPRVVVEFESANNKMRLVETANGGLVTETLSGKEDSLGVKTQYWVYCSEVTLPMVKALVALVPSVGQK